MTSMTGSKTPSAKPVRTALVVTHGRPEAIGEALERLEEAAGDAGVELIYPADEAEKHERDADGDPGPPTSSSSSAATAPCCARSGSRSAAGRR